MTNKEEELKKLANRIAIFEKEYFFDTPQERVLALRDFENEVKQEAQAQSKLQQAEFIEKLKKYIRRKLIIGNSGNDICQEIDKTAKEVFK
jgi:hypothetical protein